MKRSCLPTLFCIRHLTAVEASRPPVKGTWQKYDGAFEVAQMYLA